MKHFGFIAFAIIISLSSKVSLGQSNNVDISPKEDGQVRITQIVNVEKKTRSQIKQSAESFMETFGEKWEGTFTSTTKISKSKTLPPFGAKEEINNDSIIVYKLQIALPKSSALLDLSTGPMSYTDRELVTFSVSVYMKDGKYKAEASSFIHTNLMDFLNASGGRFENEKADWKVLKA